MQNMDDAVSDFITGTCQLIPKVCLTTLHNLIFEIALKESTSPLKLFCIVGSAAEFYIQPIQQDIWDIDIMLYSDENIVVEEFSSSLSSKLLTEYRDSITCYYPESYIHLPGYVRMRLSGVLVYDWESNRYKFYKQEFPQILSNAVGGEQKKESPGKLLRGHISRDVNSDLMSVFSEKTSAGKSERYVITDLARNAGIDNNTNETILDTSRMYNSLLMLAQYRIPMHIVHSVHCPLWPKEALSWRLRPRTSGWPDRELIEEVVQTGCDVVTGSHPLCEEPDLLWRISFARAEVVLLRHWTPVQQIAYHMLRYFARRNLINTDFRKKADFLTTYHLKTLMLWTCETESPNWWNSSSVLIICNRLLSVLYEWLRQNHCPHYFIPNCNQFSCLLNSEIRQQVLRTLESFKETNQLSQWFLENYVLQTHRKLCKSTDAKMNLRAVEHTMLLACRLVKKQMLEELEYWIIMVSSAFRLTLSNFDNVGLLQRNFSRKISEHDNMDCFSEFTQYFMALNLLHLVGFVTCKTGLGNDYKIFEVVAEIFSTKSLQKVHGYPLNYVDFLSPGKVFYTKALELMSSLSEQKSLAEFHLLAKLSIECLKASLNLQAPDMDQNYCSSVGYLAVLHHGIGHNDIAARLGSWLELRLSTYGTYPRLNGFLMLYNDDVSGILGFLQLVKRIAKSIIIRDTQIATMSTFTIELLVKYLRITCGDEKTQELLRETKLKNGTWSLADRGLFSIIQYKLRQFLSKATVGNVKAKTLIYSRFAARCFSLSECYALAEIELAELLTECALERLECFFRSVSKTFDVRCNTARCYRALYLYSRCKYEVVLALCEKLIQDEFSPLLEMKSPCFAVTTMPPFDKFYDRDIQALLGFAYLFDACCLERENTSSIFDLPVFGYSRYKTKLVVLEMNKKTFITGRFIANYLKLRCLIDMNCSVKEIAEVYCELKSRLPFEHIVRYFVLRNLLCRYISSSDAFQQRNRQIQTETKHFPAVINVHAKLLKYEQSYCM